MLNFHLKKYLGSRILFVFCIVLFYSVSSFSQSVLIGCQTEIDGSVGLDRNNFTGGTTDILSEGILHNFEIPANTFGDCKKIESIEIDITINSIDQSNLPADCNVFDYFINFSDNCPSFDPASCNDVFNQIQGFPVNQVVTFTSPPQDFDFGDVFGVDIVPAMSDVNCTNGQSTITSGAIIMEYQFCVTINIVDDTPISMVDLGLDIQGCPTSTTELDAGPFSTYNWDPAGEMTQTIDVLPGLYTVTVTDANGCSSTDDIDVTPFPVADITFDPVNPIVCQGGDILVSVSEAYSSYQWSNALTGQNQLLSEGTFTVTITDNNNCTSENTVTVGSIPPPNAGSDNFIEVCNDGTTYNMDIQLGTHDAGGTWFDNDFSGVDVNIDPFSVDFAGVPSSTYTFTYVVDGTSPCMQDEATITVNVNNENNAGINNTYTDCQDPGIIDVFDLLSNPDSGGSFTDGGSSVNLTDPSSVNFNGVPVGIYDIIYSIDANGACLAASTTLTVTIIDGVNAGINDAGIACEGSNYDLNGLVDINADLGGVFFAPTNPGILSGSIVNTTGLAGQTIDFIYEVGQASDPCGVDQAILTLTIESSLQAGDDNSEELCIGGTINLDDFLVNADLGGQYNDLNGSGLVGNMLNTDVIIAGTYNYEYVIGDGVTCPFDTSDIQLIFRDRTVGIFETDSLELCYNVCQEVNLTISGEGPFIYDLVVENLEGMTQTSTSLSSASNSFPISLCNDQAMIGFSNDTLNFSNMDSLIVTLQNVQGDICDSDFIDSLWITSLPANIFQVDTSICIFDTLVINGQEFFLGNSSFIDTIDGVRCDSFININVTFDEADTIFISEMICTGDSVNIFSTWFSESNPSGEFVVPSDSGCDSVFVVGVSFFPIANFALDTTLCAGDFIVIDGVTYDETNLSGVANLESTSSFGCDSLIAINLTYANDINIIRTDTLCQGEFIEIGGITFDQSNTMDQIMLIGSGGCDTLIDINLTFLPPSNNLINGAFCAGFDTIVNGVLYDMGNQSNIDTIVGGNFLGCDSIITINLNFVNAVPSTVIGTFCSDFDTLVNGILYDISNPSDIVTLVGGSFLGCDSIITIDLNFYPLAENFVNPSICSNDSLVINGIVYNQDNLSDIQILDKQSQFGCDSIITILLTIDTISESSPSFIICEGDSIFLMNAWQFDAGIYIDSLTNSLGCDSIITSTLTLMTCNADVNVSSIGNNCVGDSLGVIDIEILSGVSIPFIILLEEASSGIQININVSIIQSNYQFENLNSGIYIVSVIANDGTVVSTATETIIDLFDPLTGSFNLIDTIICADGLAQLEFIPTGGLLNYNYVWNSPDLGTESIIDQVPSGIYSVTVSDMNGCTFDSFYDITQPNAISISVEQIDVSCMGINDGSIDIIDIQGGTAPYTVIFNGVATTDTFIDSLAPGIYNIEVVDSESCNSMEEVTITDATNNQLANYILEYDIVEGDSILLMTELLEDSLSFNWISTSSLSCLDCAEPLAFPNITTVYDLIVTNDMGCEQLVSITVNVTSNIVVLAVPNIFSPNGDGINDDFIFGGEQISAIELRVFDRWGSLIHNNASVEGTIRWDGTSNGSELMTGVYVYQLLIQYTDGTSEMKVGDVTIVK